LRDAIQQRCPKRYMDMAGISAGRKWRRRGERRLNKKVTNRVQFVQDMKTH